jgi:hypothetical protein
MEPPGLRPQQDAGQDLHAHSRGDSPGYDAKLLRELVSLANDFHPRPNHGVGFNHLKNLVVVIGDVKTVEEALLRGG